MWLQDNGGTSLVAQRLKHLPGIQETWVWSLGLEDPLEKEMALHSSTLAWRIPWREEPGGLQSMGSQRVGHDWAMSLHEIWHQFPVLFTSCGPSTGVSASASVLPMNIQDWLPLGWTGWISLQSKGLSRVFSNTTVQKHHFFGAQLSL